MNTIERLTALKNNVTSARDQSISAEATLKEIEKNILEDTKSFEEIGYLESGTSDSLKNLEPEVLILKYRELYNTINEKINNKEKDIDDKTNLLSDEISKHI